MDALIQIGVGRPEFEVGYKILFSELKLIQTNILGGPKSLFGFFRKMGPVALSCL